MSRPFDNQALTDSCGDDKSSIMDTKRQMMQKIDSESYPKFDSGVRPSTTQYTGTFEERPSTTQYTGTFEDHTDPGGSVAAIPVISDQQSTTGNFP